MPTIINVTEYVIEKFDYLSQIPNIKNDEHPKIYSDEKSLPRHKCTYTFDKSKNNREKYEKFLLSYVYIIINLLYIA